MKRIDKKQLFSKIFTFLNKITPLVDIYIFYSLYEQMKIKGKTTQSYIFLILIGFVVFKWAKAFYYVIKSKVEAEHYLLNNRVVPICGKQRVGKSSIACYFSRIMNSSVYSNIPLKIKGKFTKKLNTDILTCRKKVPENSLFLVDEASLFYNNIKSDSEDDLIFGQAVLCQCVGHFFDGNILYVSVDTERLPKLLRDNYSCRLQVIQSECYKYSFIGDKILNIFAKSVLKDNKIYSGLRIWKAQHYERVMSEQYISLLGQTEENNQFSPVYTFATFQNFGFDTYDDRYMKAYYDELPNNVDSYWESFYLKNEDFKNMYDSAVLKYLEKVVDKKDKNIKIVDVENNDK